MELGDAGGKRKEEQSIGAGKTVRSDDDSDKAPRCVYVLHDLEKGGENGHGRVVVQAD